MFQYNKTYPVNPYNRRNPGSDNGAETGACLGCKNSGFSLQ